MCAVIPAFSPSVVGNLSVSCCSSLMPPGNHIRNSGVQEKRKFIKYKRAFQNRGVDFIQQYSSLKLLQGLGYAFNDGLLDRTGRVSEDELRPWL